jgi:diaminopropionate ammonia-lyase
MTALRAQELVTRMRFFTNAHSSRDAYTADEAQIISISSATRALTELSAWPGYGVSPLWDLPQTARRLRVESVKCKDETHRFGLGSFKALGGAYAAGLALKRRKSAAEAPTLCCATDGNHGRSVAYGARRYGCRCVIFVHEHALESKVAAMQALGAEIARVAGNYDDSVHHAKRTAAEKGWVLISDTSDSVSDQVAAEVMQGYGVMGLEAIDQLNGRLPTHVFLQAGVGGMAAAVAACFAEIAVAARPQVAVVEPESAACVMESAITQRPSHIAGDLMTNMAMLSCGETSAPAWVILSRRADAFMTVSDDDADQAAAWLGSTTDIPGGLATTPSGAAGLAGALTASEHPTIASRIGFTENSRVLIFATEGADLACGTRN